ncbi:prepilin-type N-terminal cleavage/methylation domain-containing protein [Kineococcus sp. SYSU DK004]|uniref:prepilin-type N-terminal cleavage/methylation domain-containing protein n=1 Tax=Kineococcus sp. SYSU DK004 TaxID=3383125 RepID=UPI003D7E4771
MDEPTTSDEGFSLVEVVVSMLIFALLASAVAGLLLKTSQATARGSQRQVAVNVADREKEYQLGIAWTDVASRNTTTTLNGATYAVATTVTFVPDSASGNSCSVATGASLAYKQVKVAVSWPGIGTTAPVTTEVLRPIPMAETGSTKGAVGWQLLDATGAGLPGIAATLTGPGGNRTALTNSKGCVVFSDLDEGTYTATVNQSGYVGRNNQQQQTGSATVAAGKISVVPELRYSPIATARVTTTVPAGYPVVQEYGVMLNAADGNGYDTRPVCSSGQDPRTTACAATDGTVSRLYPKSYVPYAGQCLTTHGGTSITPTVQGTPPSTTVTLGGLWLNLTPSGAGPSTVEVRATTPATASCPGLSVVLVTGPRATTREVKAALPPGPWTISVNGSDKSTVTLAPGTPASATPVAS